MTAEIEKAAGTGFCFGVKRAVSTLERVARERGGAETLGPIVHNQQVLDRLAGLGVRIASGLDDIRSDTVVLGAHGIGQQLEAEIRSRFAHVIDTTCPFVHRAQVAARRLVAAGFYVVVYGDANHPEVKGILGWADGKGYATLDSNTLKSKELPRRVGILSQTTQIPAYFTDFVKKVIDQALKKDAELRLIDTICHDIRERQQAAFDVARRSDLVLIVGSHTSANTNHLAGLCATVTDAHFVETAAEIDPAWLKGRRHVGVAGGASTAEWTIDEVVEKLKKLVR